MEKITVSEVRSNWSRILKKIERGETFKITSKGKVVAELSPPEMTKEEAEQKLKKLRKIAIIGDIISPIGETWEANK